jgi:arabinan endo-1,5-alpha-L-arabinosidase
VWRRSPDFKDWSRAVPKLLLSTKNSLCGPGGADVLQRRDGTTQLYFHSWTCYRGPYACPPDWNKDRPHGRRGVRALFGANLAWTPAGRPRIESWIAGLLPPPPPPTPTPTPTPTPSPTPSPTVTGSPTDTGSPTITGTPTDTGSPTVTVSP